METILTVKEESMIAVADAVRDKSGVEGSLSFPNGMVDAINSIETTVMSVQVDNQTIIEEDGVIRTAIGGSKTLVATGEEFYNYSDEVGITNRKSGNSRMDLPNYPTSTIFTLNPSLNYDFEIHLRNAETGYIDIMTGYTYFIDNKTVYLYGNTTITDTTISIKLYNPSDGYIEWNTGSDMFEKYYITYITFKKQDEYDYNKIDSNYIKLGAGLKVDGEGAIEGITNLTWHKERNIILQDTNTENGTGSKGAAFGSNNQLGGQGSFTAGRDNKCGNGKAMSIMIGDSNNHTQFLTFSFGEYNNINQSNSYAIGYKNTIGGKYGLAVGDSNTVNSQYGLAFGRNCIAGSTYQTVYGTGNIQDTAGTYNVIIGNSLDTSNRANGLTIDSSGNVVVQGTISNGGADYAEYFEWLDGNTNKEDRIGLLVALDGSKIRLAEADDDILGIVSGTATILGDDAEWMWQGKYEKDEFGRVIMEEKEIFHEEPIYNEDGSEILGYEMISSGTTLVPKISANYNENQEYISRANRAEWSPIGMMGKLYVRDDGTCKVNEYAAAANGIATAASGKTNMRVMERVADNIIRVCLK